MPAFPFLNAAIPFNPQAQRWKEKRMEKWRDKLASKVTRFDSDAPD